MKFINTYVNHISGFHSIELVLFNLASLTFHATLTGSIFFGGSLAVHKNLTFSLSFGFLIFHIEFTTNKDLFPE